MILTSSRSNQFIIDDMIQTRDKNTTNLSCPAIAPPSAARKTNQKPYFHPAPQERTPGQPRYSALPPLRFEPYHIKITTIEIFLHSFFSFFEQIYVACFFNTVIPKVLFHMLETVVGYFNAMAFSYV